MKKLACFLLLTIIDESRAFLVWKTPAFDGYISYSFASQQRKASRRFNFFKDMIDQAFENDRNLSSDRSKGQYDAPGEEFEDTSSTSNEALTDTQRKWRQSQSSENRLSAELMVGTQLRLDLFLSGVPERDPSNDLYGSKVNISLRDKETGLSLPTIPSTSLTIELLENGICRSAQSAFTTGENDGEWKLSDDGKALRFSMDSLGYTRTVETKGSIQKIYWTDEDEKTIRTSSTYSIPPGFVYGDIEVVAGRLPGKFSFADSGILRIEQSTGLFGVSSKLVSCGKFEARVDKD